jgi:hypothetical protein
MHRALLQPRWVSSCARSVSQSTFLQTVMTTSRSYVSHAARNKSKSKPSKSLYALSVSRVHAIKRESDLLPKEGVVPKLSDKKDLPPLNAHEEHVMRRSVYDDQITELRKTYKKEYDEDKAQRNAESVTEFKAYEQRIIKQRMNKRKVSLQNLARQEQIQDTLREEQDRIRREKNQNRLNQDAIESSHRVAFLRRYRDESKHYVTPENLDLHIERQLNPGRVLIPTVFGPNKFGINDEVAMEMLVNQTQLATFDEIFEQQMREEEMEKEEEEEDALNLRSDQVDDTQNSEQPAPEKIKVTHLAQLFPFYTDIMYPYIRVLKFDPMQDLIDRQEWILLRQAQRAGIIDEEGKPRFPSTAQQKLNDKAKKDEEKVAQIRTKLSDALVEGGEDFADDVLNFIAKNDPESFYLYDVTERYGYDPFKGPSLRPDNMDVLEEASAGNVDLNRLYEEHQFKRKEETDARIEKKKLFDWDEELALSENESADENADEAVEADSKHDEFEKFLGKQDAQKTERNPTPSFDEMDEKESKDNEAPNMALKRVLHHLGMSNKRKEVYDYLLSQKPLTEEEKEVTKQFIDEVASPDISALDFERWAALLRTANVTDAETAVQLFKTGEFPVDKQIMQEVKVLHMMKSDQSQVNSVFKDIQQITTSLDPIKFDRLIPFVQRKASSTELQTAIDEDPVLKKQYAQYNELIREAVSKRVQK